MQSLLLVGIFSLASIGPLLSADAIIQVPQIAGKTASEVTKVLGKPTAETKTKYGPKLTYKAGKVEVVFIGGKADWITVSGMSTVAFDAKAIESVGLMAEAPTFQNASVIRWEPHSAYYSVSVFPAAGKVDYAYIKVATK